MDAHTHSAHETRTYGTHECDGSVTIEICKCGAQRHTNAKGPNVNVGEWIAPVAKDLEFFA